jgi:hypothetical protein
VTSLPVKTIAVITRGSQNLHMTYRDDARGATAHPRIRASRQIGA